MDFPTRLDLYRNSVAKFNFPGPAWLHWYHLFLICSNHFRPDWIPEETFSESDPRRNSDTNVLAPGRFSCGLVEKRLPLPARAEENSKQKGFQNLGRPHFHHAQEKVEASIIVNLTIWQNDILPRRLVAMCGSPTCPLQFQQFRSKRSERRLICWWHVRNVHRLAHVFEAAEAKDVQALVIQILCKKTIGLQGLSKGSKRLACWNLMESLQESAWTVQMKSWPVANFARLSSWCEACPAQGPSQPASRACMPDMVCPSQRQASTARFSDKKCAKPSRLVAMMPTALTKSGAEYLTSGSGNSTRRIFVMRPIQHWSPAHCKSRTASRCTFCPLPTSAKICELEGNSAALRFQLVQRPSTSCHWQFWPLHQAAADVGEFQDQSWKIVTPKFMEEAPATEAKWTYTKIRPQVIVMPSTAALSSYNSEKNTPACGRWFWWWWCYCCCW